MNCKTSPCLYKLSYPVIKVRVGLIQGLILALDNIYSNPPFSLFLVQQMEELAVFVSLNDARANSWSYFLMRVVICTFQRVVYFSFSSLPQ